MPEEAGALTPPGVVTPPDAAVIPADIVKPEGEPEPKPEKSYTQEDIDRIVNRVIRKTRRSTEREVRAQAEADFLRRQAEPKEVKAESKDQPPKRDDFSAYEDYIEARAKHAAERASRDERDRLKKEDEVESTKKKETEARATWDKKADAARKTHKDFDEVMEDSEAPMTGAMAHAITESDIGPQIAYYLAKNDKEAQRIAGLKPHQAMAAIAAIEDKLLKPNPSVEGADPKNPDAQAKPSSKAPEPINPVGGKGTGSKTDTELRDDLSPEEWRRRREAQLRAQRR